MKWDVTKHIRIELIRIESSIQFSQNEPHVALIIIANFVCRLWDNYLNVPWEISLIVTRPRKLKATAGLLSELILWS